MRRRPKSLTISDLRLFLKNFILVYTLYSPLFVIYLFRIHLFIIDLFVFGYLAITYLHFIYLLFIISQLTIHRQKKPHSFEWGS